MEHEIPGVGSSILASPDPALHALFAPRAIAVVGASNDPSRIGGRPIAYCLKCGFGGQLYPVNPNRDTVQGLPAYPDLDSLPGEIDLVVVAVPAAQVAESIGRAAARGAKVAVVFSSGFGEVGTAGATLQEDLIRAATGAKVRVLGPNALGAYSGPTGASPTFTTLLEGGLPAAGGLAIVSQSGAYGAHLAMLARQRGIGFSYFVTTGNEADITVADCVMHFAQDSSVNVIACYSEGIRDGRAFLQAALAARAAGKPVIMLKVGRSDAGRKAAQSHTASVAGDDQVFEAAARFAGVERVANTQAFIDLLYTLSRRPPLSSRRLGVLTVSGGAGVLMADAAVATGLELTPLPPAAQEALLARIPFGAAGNPVDTTAQALNDITLVQDALRIMLEQGGYSAVVSFFMNWPASPTIGTRLRQSIAEGMRGFDDRTLAVVINADPGVCGEYDAAGLLVFSDPTFAVASLAASMRIGEILQGPVPVLPVVPSSGGGSLAHLDESETAALLSAAGIAMVEHRTAATVEEAVEAASTLGFPVAVKVLSPDIQHKSDAGGIALNLGNGDAVRNGGAEVLQNVRRQCPAAEIRGLLVAAMAGDGVDLILGGRVDPVFGPVVVCGLGGVFVEIFNDIAIEVAPVDEMRAEAMLRRLQAWPLLDGARGRTRADITAATAAIAGFSSFLAAHASLISSCEINPLRVLPEGEGVVGLDSLIISKGRGQ